jgi:hypothetical protein
MGQGVHLSTDSFCHYLTSDAPSNSLAQSACACAQQLVIFYMGKRATTQMRENEETCFSSRVGFWLGSLLFSKRLIRGVKTRSHGIKKRLRIQDCIAGSIFPWPYHIHSRPQLAFKPQILHGMDIVKPTRCVCFCFSRSSGKSRSRGCMRKTNNILLIPKLGIEICLFDSPKTCCRIFRTKTLENQRQTTPNSQTGRNTVRMARSCMPGHYSLENSSEDHWHKNVGQGVYCVCTYLPKNCHPIYTYIYMYMLRYII